MDNNRIISRRDLCRPFDNAEDAAGVLIFASLTRSGYLGVIPLFIVRGAICAAAGLLDEIIQLLLPNRSFRWHDVIVNVASAQIGLTMSKQFHRKVKR